MSSFNKLSIITKYIKGFDVTGFPTIHSINSDIKQHTKNTFIKSFIKTHSSKVLTKLMVYHLKRSYRAIPAMRYVLWLILKIRATYEFGYLLLLLGTV